MMKNRCLPVCLAALLILCAGIASADFNEKNWEHYAPIMLPAEGELPKLGIVQLNPWMFTAKSQNRPLADLRVITEDRAEVPYALVSTRAETRREERSLQLVNLSLTERKETFAEALVDLKGGMYNEIDIQTDDKDFTRQVTLQGSNDGKSWNTIRANAAIFDYADQDQQRFRHTKITISPSTYKNLRVLINNEALPPLKVKGLRVFYTRRDAGREWTFAGEIRTTEVDAERKATVLTVSAPNAARTKELQLETFDKNFKRRVEVYVQKNGKDWVKSGEDTIFSIDTDRMRESKLTVAVPELAATEIRLVIKNYDSPPIAINRVQFVSTAQELVFKIDGRKKYFLFWGNPFAKAPTYDLTDLIARVDLKQIATYSLGGQTKNPDFVGHDQQIPWTERYKYLLYGIVILLIGGLVAFQYKVLKKSAGGE